MTASPAPSTRARLTLLACLALAALTSCGKSLPTAATPDSKGGSGTLRGGYANTSTGDYLDDVCVLVPPGTDEETLASDYDATMVGGWYANTCVRLVPHAGETCDDLVARLSTDSRVLTAERNAGLETAETRQESYASDDGNGTLQTYQEQPAAQAIHVAESHAVSVGTNVVVAVLDTGIDPTHPLFAGRLVPGHDYISGGGSPTDLKDGIDNDGDGLVDEAWGHGTHVAGLVTLTAPGARIMPVRVLDADGRGNVATVAAGIRWAIDHGARVLNMSLGMLHSSPAITHMLAEAEDHGLIVVCSAGNSGSDTPLEYPAASGHALAIAATDADAHPAPFTSYGTHIAVCAPGIGVRSAYPGNAWRLWSGTSMSTPMVSGTAALLVALHPSWHTADVLNRLGATAHPLSGVAGSLVGKLGDGMIDAGAALAMDAHGETGGNIVGEANPKLRKPLTR